MLDIESAIDARINFVTAACQNMAIIIKKAPEGYARVRQRGNRIECSHVTKKSGRNGIYIPSSQKEKAHLLVQKEYGKKVIQCGEKVLVQLRELKDFYKDNKIEDIFGKYASARQTLIDPVVPTDEQFLKKWLSQPYTPMGFRPGEPSFSTKRGEFVRSKSEALIANGLYDAGIPYFYELPLVINGKPFRPDFACLNLRLRKIFYWEHLGMIGDARYGNNASRKMNFYMQNGYFPGVNLIITMETSDFPFQPDIIPKVIQTYLK